MRVGARARATTHPAGASLLEAVAALALAGLLLSAVGFALRTSAATQTAIRRRSALLTVARNLLEAEIAAPCAGVAPCPDEFRCSLQRRAYPAADAAGVYELSAEVVRVVSVQSAQNSEPPLRLSVLSRRDGPCGRRGPPA